MLDVKTNKKQTNKTTAGIRIKILSDRNKSLRYVLKTEWIKPNC